MFETAWDLFQRGGPVMWPLLAMSLLSIALTVDRSVFWLKAHGPGSRAKREQLLADLRKGIAPPTTKGLYARAAAALAEGPVSEGSAVDVVEWARPAFSRFTSVHAAIMASAPLLGILGTVLGIIDTFDVLGDMTGAADIPEVAKGIARALLTTAFGLLVALITLFPHAIFRAQAEACQGTLERFAAVALTSRSQKQA